MQTPDLDLTKIREKYFELAKQKGPFTAITALHQEMDRLESKVFEGGYDRSRLDLLQKFREISRELWTEKYKL